MPSKSIWPRGFLWLFSLIFLTYFSTGLCLINYTPITVDETAHLSAAHGISQGYDINLEHPPLLKTLNAAIILLNFNDYKSGNTNQWERSASFVSSGKYPYQNIITQSRLVYLLFNALIFVWLLVNAAILKTIKPVNALIFATLYTFSPSIFGHAFFITFDVAGAVSALASIFSFVFLIDRWQTLNLKNRQTHLWMTFASTFVAISTKFSNLLVVLVILFVSLGICGYNWWKKNLSALKIIFLLLLKFTGLMFLFSWILYALSYHSESIPNISDNRWRIYPPKNFWTAPILRFLWGVGASLGRSRDVFSNFIDNRRVVISYPEFINRVFWFKENPILLILILFVIAGLFWKSAELFTKYRLGKFSEIFPNTQKKIFIGIAGALFPVLYLVSAWDSRLTIGYRHFYPVLIFIYFLVSTLITNLLLQTGDKPSGNTVDENNQRVVETSLFSSKNFQKAVKLVTSATLVLYILLGISGISQSYTYVNSFWNKPKWQLTTDSTINWMDGAGWGLRYMKNENLIKNNLYTGGYNFLMDVEIAPSYAFYIYESFGKVDLEQFSKITSTDLTNLSISELKVEYLIVDIYTFQKLSNNLYTKQGNQDLARQNLDYMLKHRPFHNSNNTVFIYNLLNPQKL